MFVTVFEYLIIAGVIALQLYFFWQSYTKIQLFKSTIPAAERMELVQFRVLADDLKNVPPRELIVDYKWYSADSPISKIELELQERESYHWGQMEALGEEPDTYKASMMAHREIDEKYGKDWKRVKPLVELNLLQCAGQTNEILNNILMSINTYLVRNKGAVVDFNLLKDIIQRNLDTIEEEIQSMIPIPVYLGLMGTMFGIIIGLFSMPDVGSASFLEGGGINNLIGGVKVAMIASFTGLLFTVLNSGRIFKGAKSEVETSKNDFYTFLQTELLPILTENVNVGIYSLNRTISQFGNTFNQNVQQLDVLVGKNYDSVMAQQNAMEIFQKMDVSQIANFNVKVLSEITQSIGALEGLSFSLRNVDSFVKNSAELVKRTDDVANLSEKFIEILNESKQLQLFLNSHFTALEDRGQLVNDTVVKMDEVIDKSLKGLEQHMHERIKAVQDIKISAEDLLQREFDANRNILTKIQYLEPLSNDFNSYSKEGLGKQKESLQAITDLNRRMDENNKLLTDLLYFMQDSTLKSRVKSIFGKKKRVK
jgi:hypothetical protein